MITFVFAQLFLACISLSFGTLTVYHYANVVAQVAMLLHNLFPYIRVRYAAGGLLGLAALSSGLAWMISAIRSASRNPPTDSATRGGRGIIEGIHASYQHR